MAYSNPFQMATTPFNFPMPIPTQNATQNFPRQVTQPIDQQQFRQFAITLNDNALSNFAQMARAQGISEQDIQRGIQFIKSL